MKEYINFNSYLFSEEEKRELVDTLDSGWLTTGPKTKRFEEDFAKYIKAANAVGVTSGTAALHLALLGLGIGAGDEVITTPMTFVSTLNAIVYTSAKPVLADIEPDTLNIDIAEIRKKITKRTKAIIPVHYAGQPCRMDEIHAMAKEHKLYVVEDAAHAIETEYKGRKMGSSSNAACFSFHPIKNITTGEGGMVTTDDQAFADRVRVMRLHGMDKTAWRRYEKGQFRHWDMEYIGFKYNMTDIQASLGIQQLKKIEDFWKKRQEYSGRYDKHFKAEKNIIMLPPPEAGNRNAYHLYPIRVKTENLKMTRDEIIDAIQAKNIGVGVHFRAAHTLTYYKKYFKSGKGTFPNAEYASDRLISLPLYPKMTIDDVDYVAGSVKEIIKKAAA
ncbi:MAG: DegT/DnrJ/EryC1/StrS family aminotransferase [Candidatus Omnitrophica bacterium]|nr:DegT/DnrJ/EryC1/StrS family aminotransferase [Candidatus Omnitrophota bacterium]